MHAPVGGRLDDLGPAVAVEVLAGSGCYRVHAYDRTGAEPAFWPKWTHGWIIATPAVGDLDGDGLLDVVVGTREGNLFAWRTEGPARYPDGGNPLHWPEYHHNNRNNANLSERLPRYAAPPETSTGGCRTVGETAAAGSVALLLAMLLSLAVGRRARRVAAGRRG
jgi:hypothetical protein